MKEYYTTNTSGVKDSTFIRDNMAKPGSCATSGYVDTGEGTACGSSYGNDCWHKLPCGICRITNQMCPLGGSYKTTWTVTC